MVAELDLTAATDRRAGVTFVRAVVENRGGRRRVRLADAAGGPVWPPRSHGVPAAGWNGTGVAVVLDAGETRALGYATPSQPDDPPLTVVGVTDDPPASSDERSPGVVVRELGDPSPPRDAVPVPSVAGHDASRADVTVDRGGRMADCPAAATRIRRAEALAAGGSLPAVTRALAAVGGVEAVGALRGRVAADARRLRRRAARARELAERAERVEIPVDLLEQLS